MVVGDLSQETELLIIGAGPGGYVAACHAADLGIETTVVDSSEKLGGVCLREGCIPSKALLHVSEVIAEAEHVAKAGVTFNKPTIDIEKLRAFKDRVIQRLSGGVNTLLTKRGVTVVRGKATFEDSRTVHIEGEEILRLRFKHAIIATGSRPKRLPEKIMPADCCMDSTGALLLENVPARLLVVGGGYIGLELGQVYSALGSKVSVVEMMDSLLPGADADLVKPLAQNLKKQFEAIHLGAKLKSAKKAGKGVEVTFEADGKERKETYDRVLVSVGRQPLTDGIGLENTSVQIDQRGFIIVDEQRRTMDKRIFAIGDVAGEPMLAHKASREGKVAVEVIAGRPSAFDNTAIPAVIYTDPEIAWTGISETQAEREGIPIKVARFNWGALGRAVAMDRVDGMSKIIMDPESTRILGMGVVGTRAGDLISEGTLAVEMAALAEELGYIIHPHPALAESIGEAAEALLGHAIHALTK